MGVTVRAAQPAPDLAAVERGVPEGPSRLRRVLVLGSLVALGPFTIDLYLPALPSITEDLRTSAAAVQLTLTGTLLGVALGQLIVGPLSDAFGRRRPLLAGIALHVVASLLCLLAPTVQVLGALRLAQGLGAAAASVVALAVVRDLYDGNDAARLIARLTLVLGVAPVLAPTLGSGLLRVTDWRGVFVALAALGLALTVVAGLLLEETLPPQRRRRNGLRGVRGDYATLLHDRAFVGLIVVQGAVMAALFSYVSGSSFVLQEQYDVSEQQFGLLFGGGAVGLIGGTQLSARLLDRWAAQQVLSAALTGGLVSGAVLLAVAATGAGGLVGVLAALWVLLAFVGLALPNAPALALSRHGSTAGTAAAMLGAVQFGVGAAVAPLVGVLGNDSLAMGAVMTMSLAAAVLVLRLVVRPGQLPPAQPSYARGPVRST